MVRSLLQVFRFVRLHLWRFVTLGLLLAAGAFGGVNLWAWHHFRAAEKALRDDEVEAATDHISRCLRVWWASSQTHLLAARIDRAAGRYPDAERHLRECRKLHRGASEEAQLEEILLRAQSGELREVEAGLWKCVDSGHAESTRILETLARVYMRDYRSGSALQALDRWLKLDPQAAPAYHWRGWLYERVQEPEQAIPAYEKAVELQPDRWGARLRLVRLLLKRNYRKSVSAHLQELLRTHGDDNEVQIAHAQALMLENKEEEAEHVLEKLLESRPKDVEALYLSSQLASQQDPPHEAEAEAFLRRALAEHPVDLRLLHALYLCLEHQGKEKEASAIRIRHDQVSSDIKRLAHLTKYDVENAPYDAEVLCEVGELQLRLGEEETGLRWMERALRHNPNHKKSHEILIRYYESKGQTAKANGHRQYLARLVHRAPSSAESSK